MILTRKNKKKCDIKFNSKFAEVNRSIENVNESFVNLQDNIVNALVDSKVYVSGYDCPKCKSKLWYDYIGREDIRLYCPNCEKYVLGKINQLEKSHGF